MKVMTIVGTRPELIKLSEIIKKCDRYFEHVLVHTGQNFSYSLNEVFFKDLELKKPDDYLEVATGDLGSTIGNVISRSWDALRKYTPDALLLLGDTNSSLCAISAKRLKIPVFHLEAGNRCFDENLPEEINRRIVDHISDVNLPYTEHARRYLLSEGICKEYVFVVGSPMAEVLEVNEERIRRSEILDELGLRKNQYIILSAHREENIDNEANFESLVKAIDAIAQKYEMPVIYSVHPRSAAKIKEKGIKFHNLVRELEPFPFSDYIQLQKNAFCVVSDSGTLPEESSYFKFPAVSIRTSTERPEAMETGNFIIGSINSDNVVKSVDMAVEMAKSGQTGSDVKDYADKNVSNKVVKIIQSYVPIINTNIWHKNP